jgi:hypothetical protein
MIVMLTEQKTCPICGSTSDQFLIDNTNLSFLSQLNEKNEINVAISMTRIIWENVPQLRLTADSKIIVDELSKTLLENTQEKINKILEPMKIFVETFPKLIEKLPESLRRDVREEFDDTKIKIDNEFKTLRETTPTVKDTIDAIRAITDGLNETTEKKMEEIKQELTSNFKETLEEMGFPEPDQLKLLAQLIPSVLPLLDELLRFQKVPSEKGKQGELELIQELRDYYPGDEYESLGGPGDTDIIAIPRYNGASMGHKILIESKNNGSGWNRSYLEQVREHMKLRSENLGLLVVQTMPKGANGFIFEHFPEGTILVTDRTYFAVSYGALRAAFVALQPFRRRELDFQKLFSDKRINEAIQDAYSYSEWVKRIKEKARRIEANSKGISEDANQLDQSLKRSLEQLQARIDEAVQETKTEDP